MATQEMPNPEELRKKYPPNSNVSKDRVSYDLASKKTAEESDDNDISETKVRQVATAKVHKQSLLKRIGKSILEDGIAMARERAINDIIIPGFKSLIFDTVTEMFDIMLFGNSERPSEGSRRRSSGSRRSERVSYSDYYDGRSRRGSERYVRESLYEPDDIILDTRNDARAVLDELDMAIRKYGQASVADLYDIVGVTSEWTDNKYGWTSLRGVAIKPVRNGFMLDLPRTQVLD